MYTHGQGWNLTEHVADVDQLEFWCFWNLAGGSSHTTRNTYTGNVAE